VTSSDTAPQDPARSAADLERLDALVGEWLNLPGFADRLGTSVSSVRSALRDRRIVGVKRGERQIFSIPAVFLVASHMSNPADLKRVVVAEGGHEKVVILPSLQGTVIMLADQGLTDVEILEWLFSEEEMLGETPMRALLTGRKSAVRRAGQAVV
jgi:hypothetical protein